MVNIENASLSSMGTEQLMNMFDSRATAATLATDTKTAPSDESTQVPSSGGRVATSSYQRMLENIGELWDESQYENEYNMDSFLKSLT